MSGEERLQVYPLRGMDHRFSPPQNSAALMRDLTWDQREGWKSAGGYRRLTEDYENGEQPPVMVNGFDGMAEIISLHTFSQHTGARHWLIWETADGELMYFNGSTAPAVPYTYLRDSEGNRWDGSERSRTVVDGAWVRSQSAAWGNWLYIVNGYDEPLCFDGRKTTRAGFDAAPGAPSAYFIENIFPADDGPTLTQDELGLGIVNAKYGARYKVSFINERGQESPLSEASALVVFDNTDDPGTRGGYRVTIPTGPLGTTQRRVYRNVNVLDDTGAPIQGADDVFFFHSQIDDNDTVSFEDFKPDSALGTRVDELDLGAWPAGARFIAVFKNTVFLGGTPDNQIRFSAPGYSEVFPPDNRFDISDSQSGPQTSFYVTKNALIVFRQRGIVIIKGDPLNGFYSVPISSTIGCEATRTVRELPGLGVVFLGSSGLYVLQGALENTDLETQVTPISTPIADWFNQMNSSALQNACAAIYRKDREYWLAVPRLGEVRPTRVLVFHYEVGAWTYRDNYPISCMVESNDARGYLFFGTYNTGYPGVMVYSRGWEDKGEGEADIRPYYEGSPISFASVYRVVSLRHAQFTVIGHGTNTLEVNFRVNRRMSKGREDGDKTEPQHYPYDIDEEDTDGNTLLPVYGVATWGGAYKWGEHRPVVLRVDLTTINAVPVHELAIIAEPTGRQFTLCGYEIDIVGGQAGPKVLTMTSGFGGGSR